jgi:hypothetical protein
MFEQKDISTWTTSDITFWLKSINMTQYASKFELNKINGYDLIYLTKEDLKNLGIVNIHDKNVILNSMKNALLQQLKLKVNYKDKSAIVQLDFDPNFTVEQLIKNFITIFKPDKDIFLVINDNEILISNLKIIDLILYEPKIYKNFKISDDISNTNNYNSALPNLEENTKLLTKTPNKNIYKNYYNINVKEYKTEKDNLILNKTVEDNNRLNKTSTNYENLENLYNNDIINKKYNLNKKDLINYNNNRNINNKSEFITNYKTYDDYNKAKELNNYENNIIDDMNIKKNNLYEYKNVNIPEINQNELPQANATISAYRKNYLMKNEELNLDMKNLNLNAIKNEEEDSQKYSSEKRNYRLKEINLNRNYDNNGLEEKNNFNYDLNGINENNNGNIGMNYTSAFNERLKYNNNLNLNYQK